LKYLACFGKVFFVATIGAIKIRAAHTVVDLPEGFVGQVLAKNGDYQVRKQLITIEKAKQL
jgi:hypothetical protein